LAKLVERDTADGKQLLDVVQVKSGFEKALGAALADDLRAPQIGPDDPTGWALLPGYTKPQSLPDGVNALASYVTIPEVLARRMSQVGLVEAKDGPRLQAELKPGQRLVSVEGDLWRWDGFRTDAEDAPSSAALRLEQLNRLEELKQGVERASASAAGARAAHEHLTADLEELTAQDRAARTARREADRSMAEAARALSRAEGEKSMAEGKLETLTLAVTRYEEEAMAARKRLQEAEKGVEDLGDLDAARAQIEDVKMTVEAARMTMLAKRSSHDELRRAGEQRLKRSQEITTEISGWKHRLATAEKRIAELEERKESSEVELKAAESSPDEIAAKREELASAIEDAETRRRKAADALAEAETVLREAVQTERAERVCCARGACAFRGSRRSRTGNRAGRC